MQSKGRNLLCLIAILACIAVAGIGVAVQSIFIFAVSLLALCGVLVYSISKMYENHIKPLLAIFIAILLFSLFPLSNATTVTWDFESDTPGQDPTGWNIDESTNTNIEVYDDGGNKRCFLDDDNPGHFEYASMYRNFSDDLVTDNINITFDVKITEETNHSFFHVETLVTQICVDFINTSGNYRDIIVYDWNEGTPHKLADYQLNSWKTISIYILFHNFSYAVTDYNNTIWGDIINATGEKSIAFSTDPLDSETTDNTTVNASVDNIIISYGSLANLPQVETMNATLIRWNSARLNGNLTSMGDASSLEVGFQFGTSPGTYTSNFYVDTVIEPGTFQCSVGNLEELTTYYYRAYAFDPDTLTTVYGEEKSFTTHSRYGYHIDQECYGCDHGNFWVGETGYGIQSFKPSMPIITKISLYIEKELSPSDPLNVYLIDDTDNILRSITLNPGDVPSTISWVEWDINDLFVSTSRTYYIKLQSDTDVDSGIYYWKTSYDNCYQNGSFTYSCEIPGYDPSQFSNGDAFFRIYGRANLTAHFTYTYENLTIYVDASNSSSNPGSIVYYQWDWDGNGWYEDEGITATHTYSQNGTYNVTLKIVNEYGDWLTATTSITVVAGQNGTGETENSSQASGDEVNDNEGNNGNGGGWFTWKLPFSWFAIFILAFVGIIGFALAAFFMKPESIQHLGYAPAAGTILSTILILTSILLYHADVAWYWTALSIAGAFFIIFLTVKIVLASPKRKKIVKRLWGR